MASAVIGSSIVFSSNVHLSPSPITGEGLKSSRQCLINVRPSGLSSGRGHLRKSRLRSDRREVAIQAAYSEQGEKSNASIFVGGFVLGGLIVGALGCVFAPQISRALASADRKELMRKLPKFIYDEEKALERTRKILTDKIAQLNSAIDDVSSQLRAEGSNDAAVISDEVETAA